MNYLVVDIGNTNAKIACFAGNRLVKSDSTTILQLTSLLQSDISEHSIDAAIVCSVSADTSPILSFLSANGVKALELSSKLKLPFTLEYGTPQTIGSDRLAAVAGAVGEFGNKPMLVIDAGTAITYEFVESGCIYIGGNISPGMSMRFSALHDFTARLPLVSGSQANGIVGHTTVEAIANGVVCGIVNEMKGYIDDFINANSKDSVTILTGGDAYFFDKKLKNAIFARPNLVLNGLQRILIDNL